MYNHSFNYIMITMYKLRPVLPAPNMQLGELTGELIRHVGHVFL